MATLKKRRGLWYARVQWYKQNQSAQTNPSPSPVSQFYALISRRFKIFTRDKTQLILQAAMIIGFPLLVIVFGLEGITQPKTLPTNTRANN